MTLTLIVADKILECLNAFSPFEIPFSPHRKEISPAEFKYTLKRHSKLIKQKEILTHCYDYSQSRKCNKKSFARITLNLEHDFIGQYKLFILLKVINNNI